MKASIRTRVCFHCGAPLGLHHYKTLQCPRGGQEARADRSQRWDETTYCDSGAERLRRAAPDLLVALVELYLWAKNQPGVPVDVLTDARAAIAKVKGDHNDRE